MWNPIAWVVVSKLYRIEARPQHRSCSEVRGAGRKDLHIDAEEMRQQRLTDMQTESSKEDGQQEQPLQVLNHAVHPALSADAVAHSGEGQVAETVEDDDDGEPDFPGVEVVFVEVAVEPT